MAVEGATQALIAAFFFGIVLNAASASFVLYLGGHGLAPVFRDSQRLVLVSFLISAALWALVDFITVLLDITTSPTPCQVGIIFSTVFDQFARFSIEQFLLWALNASNGAKLSFMQMASQGLVLARFLAGAVFIGFARPQTDTFCVATTSVLPVGILVTALDGVIVLFLVINAYSAGGVAKGNSDRAGALMSVLAGLTFWTGASVPLLLGIRSLAFATRTALPAGGLLILLVAVTAGFGSLLTSRDTASRSPEALSPRRINISRDVSTSDTDYPPTRYEDLKEAALRSSTTFINPRQAPRVKDETTVEFPVGLANGLRGGAVPPLPIAGLARKKSVVNLPISHPVLQENAGQNPLDKIAVMDLQQAAVAERERRARMHAEESAPVRRSTAPSMGMAPEEVMKRGVSLKRKEVASVSLRESMFPGSLQPEGLTGASTTSLQLSPGGDQTRRRSPRPSLSGEPVQLRPASPPVQVPEPAKARSDSPPARPLTMQQPLLRTDIRPSRMLPPSPKAPPPEPTKTPLQRRPTIGLPTNPRAQGLQISDEAGSQHRTILFVNNIEYNDPLVVEAILKGAGNSAPKTAPAADTAGFRASVVNRPRPIPRKPADSPAHVIPSPSHRRSKSGGSLMGRKSLLMSSPGSPTQLPPLPSLPRSATLPARPHPNDTRSMTAEEKVTLFFPIPPSANQTKRRSSVPDVPRIPASYLDMDSPPGDSFDRQGSDRTTQATLQSENVFDGEESKRASEQSSAKVANGARNSWLRDFGIQGTAATAGKRPSATQSSGKRGSSPIIPELPVRVSAWTETTYDRSEDDASNWSAVASPELAVGISVVQRLGQPAAIQMRARQDTGQDSRGLHVSLAGSRSSATLPIMLDASTFEQADISRPVEQEHKTLVSPARSTWHRRVGDECPTFSGRSEKRRSKKLSPPAPLLLDTVTTRMMVPIHVEPSPLESPAQALRQIQEQLKKLEELEQASPQSASKRQALLEDLEREMGQQAEHWQEIKHDMGRDSMSSMQTASRRESVASTVNHAGDGSLRQSIGAERRASRLLRLRDNSVPKMPAASVRNSGSPQLSKWQKRLTEAQMDYMDAQLVRGSTVNFMQLSKAQLASPTPPDSDYSDQSDDEILTLPSRGAVLVTKQVPVVAQAPRIPLLWAPLPKESVAQSSLLWTPPSKATVKVEAPLPGLSVRPNLRKESTPLRIESSRLWRKPYNTAHRSTTSLWRPVWAAAAPPAQPVVRTLSKAAPKATPSQSPKAPRPVTQRPPRRNKRVTLLPDILESPEPLPDKRGTLGIFQFPWGEKSDTASIQPRPSMYMAMPGTMTSGGPRLGAQSRQAEPTGYSSSFFDDYDDEDDGEVMDSDVDDSEDDGFDETTLWEIASLLKTESVPSRDSLLPPPSDSSVVDDYIDDSDSDREAQSPRGESIVIGLAEPRELFIEQQRDSATIESSTLLMLEDALESKTPPSKPATRIGLPANPKAALSGQTSSAAKRPAAKASPASEVSRMPVRVAEAKSAQKQGSSGLWRPLSQGDKPSSNPGLFVSGSRRSVYRGTSEEPAAKYTTRTPRPIERKPLDQLTSTKLWTSVNGKQGERNWILGARNPKHKPSSRIPVPRRQRPQSSSEDWKRGLKEAVAASYPRTKKLTRVAAGPAEWKAALQEAVSLSARASLRQSAFNSAVCHPVFAASSLTTRSALFHPAATGYTYDVAAVHPVFFGSRAVTCSEDAVHPAFSGYVAKSSTRQRGSDSRSERKADTLPFARYAAIEKPTHRDTTPPLPARDPIQAQIEALEQERLFVERAAQEEYRRRLSSSGLPTVMAVQQPAAVEAMMPAGAETVQDLQRRMSQQIRQSLVFAAARTAAAVKPMQAAASAAPPASVATPGLMKSEAKELPRSRIPQPAFSANASNQGFYKQRLWTPTVRVLHHSTVSTGMWTPAPKPSQDRSTPSPGAWAAEDGHAAAQRRRRRTESSAQVGTKPVVEFAGMGLWSGLGRKGSEKGRGWERDWLGSVCVKRTKGVVLRY